MSDSTETPRAAKAAGQALAATTGLAIGGPAGAIVGAVVSDAFVQLAGRAWDELRNARQRSVGALIAEAAERLDTDPDAMVEHALSDTHRAQLLHDAMTAAGDTLLDEKVRGLAKALANGLADDGARVEEERLMIRALADLEPIHVRLLAKMYYPNYNPPFSVAQARIVVGEDNVSPVMAVLERHGLVDEDDRARSRAVEKYVNDERMRIDGLKRERQGGRRVFGTPGNMSFPDKWQLTDFGRRCLAYLEDRSDEQEAGGDSEL